MNPIALNIFGISITWYAILIVSALLIGIFIAYREVDRHEGLSRDELNDFLFYLIIFAFLGARIWYVIFDFDTYRNNLIDVFKIYEGGLAIHGAILAGFLYIVYYTKKNHKNFFLLTDIAVPSLLLGQAIGRWGNFFNQEAHGGPTTKEFLSETLHLPNFIVEGMHIGNMYYQPTFLYESIWNLLGFIIIMVFLRKRWRYQYGKLSAFYLMWYGFIRTFIEMMRTDALRFFNTDIKIALVTSVFMFIAGACLFAYLTIKDKEKKNNV